MKSFHIIFLVLFLFLTGCQKKNVKNSNGAGIKVKELKTYHTLIPNNNLLVGLPVRLRYHDNHLFIEDFTRFRIIEINDSNKVVKTFGRKGRGPGEEEDIENFFITKKYLFIVDGSQFLINKYDLQDSHYISSLDYGQFLRNKPPLSLPLTDIYNKVFVTLKGTVLLPTQTGGKFLYEEINWSGKKLADIGDIPKGYKSTENQNAYWSDLENKKIPAKDLCEVFPVNDRADPKDIYLVYSAISKIAKYNLSGKKIWEHKIPRVPEINSLMINLSNRAKMVENHPSIHVALIPIRTYATGRCSPAGDLYLVTYTDLQMSKRNHRPMWIHQFNPEGKLVKRYEIVSKADVNLSFYPGIDFENYKIFVSLVINNNGIRTYHY